MKTKNAVLVLLPFAALAGCATQPPTQTSSATAVTTAPVVCREISTPDTRDVNPLYCGTSEQVAAVQSRPELLASGVVCQKMPEATRDLSPETPVCMLPEQWKRVTRAQRLAATNRNYSTVTDGAHEYAVMTVAPIPGIDVWVPPGQVPGQP